MSEARDPTHLANQYPKQESPSTPEFQQKPVVDPTEIADPIPIRRIMSMSSFEGPLPPPHTLEAYNRIVPNGAERIFRVFEKQVEHRHELERTVINTNMKLEIRGFYAALVIAVGTISAGFWLAYMGRSLAGIAAIIVPLASLLAVFILGRKKESGEREAKRKAMPRIDPGT